MDLIRCFAEWNLKSFGGKLPVPELRFNSRLKTTAGRFIPARRNRLGVAIAKPIIEVASYLTTLSNGEELIKDTMGHEMIHYWLWFFRKPYGHTPSFHQKMNEIGVSRYNTAPQHRPFKHCYVCDECGQKILVRKRLPKAACAACCNQHSAGAYHAKFALRLDPVQHDIVAIANQRIAKSK